MPNEPMTFMVEDAKLIFKNFSGKETMYNQPGERNFCVVLDPETAAQMAEDGWNVRTGKERDEGEVGDTYIPVKVNFKIRPPRVVMITSASRVNLDEDSIDVLDYADIRKVDLIANASYWGPINGKSGIKAYLKSMFVTIEEDELERKYAHVEDSSYGDDPV